MMNIRSITAGAVLALLPLFSTAANAQGVSLEVGQTKSLRLKTQISSNWITGGGNVVRVWFDRNTNRLKFKGIGVGYATVTFAGNKVRYLTGVNNRLTRKNVPFKHVIRVYVKRSSRKATRPTSRKKLTNKSTSRTTRSTRKAPAARKIVRQGSWRIEKGRVRSVLLSGILNGQITRDLGLSVRSRSVAAAQVKNGKLMIKGLGRGSTTVYLRGKVMQGRKLVPYVIQVNVTVS